MRRIAKVAQKTRSVNPTRKIGLVAISCVVFQIFGPDNELFERTRNLLYRIGTLWRQKAKRRRESKRAGRGRNSFRVIPKILKRPCAIRNFQRKVAVRVEDRFVF